MSFWDMFLQDCQHNRHLVFAEGRDGGWLCGCVILEGLFFLHIFSHQPLENFFFLTTTKGTHASIWLWEGPFPQTRLFWHSTLISSAKGRDISHRTVESRWKSWLSKRWAQSWTMAEAYKYPRIIGLHFVMG